MVIENVKADVYVPPGILLDMPQLQPEVARLVQSMIERIGFPVTERWQRVASSELNWTFSSSNDIKRPRTLPVIPFNTRTSLYTFWGCPTGELETLLGASNQKDGAARAGGAATQGKGATRSSGVRVADDSCADTSHSARLARLTEEAEDLRSQNRHLRDTVQKQAAEIKKLRSQGMFFLYDSIRVYSFRTSALRVRALPFPVERRDSGFSRQG